MSAEPRLARKETRAFIRRLKPLGWTLVGLDAAGHVQLEHQQYGQVSTPGTPRNARASQRATVERIARLMGVSKHELWERIHGQSGRKRPADERKARRGKQAPRRGPAATVMPIGSRAPRPRTVADIDRDIDKASAERDRVRNEVLPELNRRLDALYAKKRQLQAARAA